MLKEVEAFQNIAEVICEWLPRTVERKEWREEGMEGGGYLRDLPEGGEGLPQRLRLNFRTEVADEDVVVLCKRQEAKGSHSSARFLYFGLGWVKLYKSSYLAQIKSYTTRVEVCDVAL